MHGLGGDSRKTWGTTDGQAACWPADWLPQESGFERIRIQTFGYDTKFLKGPGNCLNVHHLGKLLLGELETSPTLGLSKTRIVFVAHSMGGLVVKKTFLLAKQDPTYHTLAERMDAIIFLACPHHGADSAKLLRRVLSPVYDRQYLADLERNSPTLQAINNDFRQHAPGLVLWSFYETQKMHLWSSLVVDETSAVLNYPEEKQIPMSADHRSICKFNDSKAANYLTIKNSIAFIVNGLRTKSQGTELLISAEQMRTVRELLGYSAPTDDILDSLNEKREPDTCDWILSNECYMNWTSQAQSGHSVLWISGKPGWGKSVLASFVVDHLSRTGSTIHSYFFQFSDYRKSTFEDCLRSLAYQLALSNETCRASLLELHAEGLRLDGVEARPFWRTLLRSGSLRGIRTRQYVVIDGFDECGEPQAALETLVQMLEEESSAEFRLLIIGRELPSLSGSYNFRPGDLQRLTLESSHTSAGLSRVISRRIPFIPAIKPRDRNEIGAKILELSQGSFLFADLVLRELASCHGQMEVSKTLETMPGGMEPVYGRIIETIAEAGPSKDLTHAILRWIICISRPFTVNELQTALEIDLDTTFPHFGESVVTLCGQLVTVDQIGRIKLQHETAKHFLLNQQQRPDFSFDEGGCHARIAKTCLRLFGKREFRRDLISGANLTGFEMYALLELPLHLSKATDGIEQLLESVERFLKLHILDWIQVAVKHRGVSFLNLASERLRTFCSQCQCHTRDSRFLRYLSQVANDLPQLSRKFGEALASDVSIVHTIIPHFCPSESSLYKARKPNQNFHVVGDLGAQWSDIVSSLSLEYRAVIIQSKGSLLAIGMRQGVITVFDTSAYTQFRKFEHTGEVKHLAFSEDGQLLASSGDGYTQVWSLPQCECLHEFIHDKIEPLGLEFDDSRLLMPHRQDVCFAWDLSSHKPEEGLSETKGHLSDQSFLAVAVSIPSRLIVSRCNNVTVLDLDTGDFIRSCATSSQDNIGKNAVVKEICINPKNGLLAVAREDELVILEPRHDEIIQRRASTSVLLATGSNGRLLASLETRPGGSATVNVYDFETLDFLHKIDTGTNDIEMLSFSKADAHLIGIYGHQAKNCLIWELPSGLSRDAIIKDTEAKPKASALPRIPGSCDIEGLLVPPGEDFIICAKADGVVSMFDRKTASFRSVVYRSSCIVRSLHWWPSHRAVLCVGIDNEVRLQSLPEIETGTDVLPGSCIFDLQIGTKTWIHDVSIANEEGKVLLSDLDTTFLYADSGQLLGTAPFRNLCTDRQFVMLPQIPNKALCFGDHIGVHIYDINGWTGNPRITDITGFVDWPWRSSVYAAFNWQRRVHLSADCKAAVVQGRVMSAMYGPRPVLIRLDLDCIVSKHNSYISPPHSPLERSPPGTPVCYSELYNVPVRQVVGVLGEDKVLFVDESMWLSSLDLRTAHSVSSYPGSDGSSVTASLGYHRHFFIPAEFFKGEDVEISCAISGEDLALVLRGRPVLVKGFLGMGKEVRFDSYVSSEVLGAGPWR